MAQECQLNCLCGEGLRPSVLASLEEDGVGLKEGPEESRRGAAHSEAQWRGGKSAPREGMLVFRGEKGEWLGTKGCDERLDLGLQDAPRSTVYTDQTNRQKGGGGT